MIKLEMITLIHWCLRSSVIFPLNKKRYFDIDTNFYFFKGSTVFDKQR